LVCRMWTPGMKSGTHAPTQAHTPWWRIRRAPGGVGWLVLLRRGGATSAAMTAAASRPRLRRCFGGATTLIAAAMEGRRAVGSEMDLKTYALAQARIAKGHTPDMFSGQQ
jgi:hypothetical protein